MGAIKFSAHEAKLTTEREINYMEVMQTCQYTLLLKFNCLNFRVKMKKHFFCTYILLVTC